MAKRSPRRQTGGRRMAWEPESTVRHASVTGLDSYRRARNERLAREAMLDHFDAMGWCCCWVQPGRRHRVFWPSALTGTGAL